MIGLNIAVSTLVGQKLGENKPDLAERATWTSLQLGMAYTGLFALLYLAIPDVFLALHSTPISAAYLFDEYFGVRFVEFPRFLGCGGSFYSFGFCPISAFGGQLMYRLAAGSFGVFPGKGSDFGLGRGGFDNPYWSPSGQ
jgi:hypothetical protein